MKICSFLPAATTIIKALELESLLKGVTFECQLDRPRVVRSILEGGHRSSAEIDRVVRDTRASGKRIHYLDEAVLQSIAPDVVICQELCELCQIDTDAVDDALKRLPKPPKVLALNPLTLEDVFENIAEIAAAVGHPERGTHLLEALRERIAAVRKRVRERGVRRPKVFFIEWIDPIFGAAHWIPEQIEIAGGFDSLASPGGYSWTVEWEKVRIYNPDVIIVSPCGFDAVRAKEEIKILEAKPGWNEIRAVGLNQVHFVDADLFTEPGPRLVDGIEVLFELFYGVGIG